MVSCLLNVSNSAELLISYDCEWQKMDCFAFWLCFLLFDGVCYWLLVTATGNGFQITATRDWAGVTASPAVSRKSSKSPFLRFTWKSARPRKETLSNGWLVQETHYLYMIIAHTEISCWRPDQDWWLSPIRKSQTVSALSHQNNWNGLNTSLITGIGACREHMCDPSKYGFKMFYKTL